MGDTILKIEGKPFVEQVHEFLAELTPQQQREFELMLQAATVTMKLMNVGQGDGQHEAHA